MSGHNALKLLNLRHLAILELQGFGEGDCHYWTVTQTDVLAEPNWTAPRVNFQQD